MVDTVPFEPGPSCIDKHRERRVENDDENVVNKFSTSSANSDLDLNSIDLSGDVEADTLFEEEDKLLIESL